MDKEEKANVVIIHYLFAISPQTRQVGLLLQLDANLIEGELYNRLAQKKHKDD